MNNDRTLPTAGTASSLDRDAYDRLLHDDAAVSLTARTAAGSAYDEALDEN